jgi:hypothetical protein
VTCAYQEQPAYSCHLIIIRSALFAIQTVLIMTSSLKMTNGFVQIKNWRSPFQIFNGERVKYHAVKINIVNELPDDKLIQRKTYYLGYHPLVLVTSNIQRRKKLFWTISFF